MARPLHSTPVVIGVGDVKNASRKMEDAKEPLLLMLRATEQALKDCSVPEGTAKEIQSHIDSVDVVRTWTWPYPDLPGSIAERLGIRPQHKAYSEHGGHSPAKLLDEAARRVASGQSTVALVTGGEALASLDAFVRAKRFPPQEWTPLEEGASEAFDIKNMKLDDLGAIHSIGLPVHIYPLYENGFRAHRRQSIRENNQESAQLYGDFAKVAESNPYAWSFGKPPQTAQSIGTVTKNNRLICSPYPLLMNAFNAVNLAAACILTTTEQARKFGVPESQWIYPLGGAGTAEANNFWERGNFYSSPAISRSLDTALDLSGLRREEIDYFDFYSCFPIVPKLACKQMGLPIINPPKPITLLGGLTSFGGAGNNYSMHAITAMVRQLRQNAQQRRHGLVLANGGVLSYQHAVVLSSQPRSDGSSYPEKNPLPAVLADESAPSLSRNPEGEAVIETYTVEFNRDGSPFQGYVVGRLKSTGSRFISNHADENTLRQLSSTSVEQIGRTGFVRSDPGQEGRNLFSFAVPAKL
ncbi:hypothetical protein LOZ53_000374 [Ophidiomyces ophidiicola]|nr:hypothetical protein LOZ55_002162 [Ophidiomyces ophidiicola]KAI1992205.1 hypothetical protein LOZ54_001821 [Ophidiomyces ophidiicola]KAI1993531.1 hypothetical protein LOZ51_003910 [Ophidiomyces ophidiicola]KAI1997556.1 hypothetical protein LOZ53_000374 [Ophidiomyces ophidiicola]